MSEGREFSPATQKAAIDAAISCVRGATKPRASEREMLCEALEFIRARIERAGQRAAAPPPGVTLDDALAQIERLLRVTPGGDVKNAVQQFLDDAKRRLGGD